MGISRLADKDRKRAIEYLTEGNTPKDLADLYLEKLNVIELKELMKEVDDAD